MPRAGSRRAAPLLVWGVWATSLLVFLICIARDGWNLPRAEDWLLVPVLTGHEEGLTAWLWAQNNEHRVPLPRLVYGAVLHATGIDFRAGMVFNTLAIAAVAFAMIRVAARVRGRLTWTDAVFPLVLLHLGHWDNLFLGWQVQFVLSTALASALLLVLVTGDRWSWGRSAIAAVSLTALPLCGANGLAFAPALGLWAAVTGIREWWRSRGGAPLVVVAAAVVALVLTLAYFVDFQRPPGYPPSPGPAATVATAAKFLAMAFGPGAGASWPTSAAAIGSLLALTGGLLVWTAWSRPGADRWRALGLMAFVVSVVILAAGVGWGRAGRVAETGRFSSRYALLAAPLLACIYFAWLLYGPRRWRPAVLGGLAVAAALMLPENTLRGLSARGWHLQGMRAVARDIEAGIPRRLLAERHQPFLLHWDREMLETGMAHLREAGRGPFARLQEAAVHEMKVWSSDPGGTASPPPADIVVAVPGTPRVYAVRVLFHRTTPAGGDAGRLDVSWTGPSGAGQQVLTVPDSNGGPGQATVTAWVNAEVDTLRLAGTGTSRAGAVTLVVPVAGRGTP